MNEMRYGLVMFTLAAAAAIAISPPQDRRPAPVVAQADVTVRIVSGVRLKLDSPNNPDAPPAHDAKVATKDGEIIPARLIEFE
jgi:hypothetical protein